MAGDTSSVALGNNSTKKRIVIEALGKDGRATYSADPSAVLFFDFDLDAVAFSRDGDSMLIHQMNGAIITLKGLFSKDHSGYPVFSEQDGTTFSGKDFLSTLSPRLDIDDRLASADQQPSVEDQVSTEAGPAPAPPSPAAQSPSGGGVGEFRNLSGELIGSVERLGYGARSDGALSAGADYDEPDTVPGGSSPENPIPGDISIYDPFGSGPGGPAADEAGLPSGTGNPSARFTGWQELELPSGVTIPSVPEGGSTVIKGAYGSITIRHMGGSSYTYNYELEEAYSHAPGEAKGQSAIDADIIPFDISDGFNTGTASIAIDIIDDEPRLEISGSGDSAKSGYEYTGEWNVDFGADGRASDEGFSLSVTVVLGGSGHFVTVTGPIVEGAPFIIAEAGEIFGTITLKDGAFSFTPVPDLDAGFEFVLSAKDGDGDIVSSNTLAVNVSKGGDPNLPDKLGDGVILDEANLVAGGEILYSGTEPDAALLTRDIELPANYTVDTVGWTPGANNTLTKQGDFGFLSYSEGPNGPSLTYTLTKAPLESGPGKNTVNDSIDVTLLDGGKNTTVLPVVVDIADDIPAPLFGGASGQNAALESGASFSGGIWSAGHGADGPSASGSLAIEVSLGSEIFREELQAGQGAFAVELGGKVYGWLDVKADGTYSFKAAPDTIGKLAFTLTAKDGDGDETTSSEFTLDITAAKGPDIAHLGEGLSFNEANLADGTNPLPGELNKSIDLPDGFTVDVTAPGWNSRPGGGYEMKGDNGILVCSGNGRELSYILQEAAGHGAPGTADDKSLQNVFPGIILKDANGNNFSLPAKITIVDDAPLVSVSSGGSVGLGGDIYDFSTKGELDVAFGADGDGGDNVIPVTLEYAYQTQAGPQKGSIILNLPRDGSSVAFDTAMGKGTLHFDAATGRLIYSYQALRGMRGETEDLSFAVRDGDGDHASAAMTFTLENSVPAAIFGLDEGGLPFGSGATGHGPSSLNATLPGAEMPDSPTSLVWDVQLISPCEADGNDDGVYSAVTWKQEGEMLRGYAEGELVAEISPVFDNGVFTGEMSAAIHKAFKHSGSATVEDELRLVLNLGLENASGEKKDTAVALVIKDDAPFGNTGPNNSLDRTTSYETRENGGFREDVYLLIDITISMTNEEAIKQIEAIRFLAQTYKDSGIDACLTLIPFGGALGDSLGAKVAFSALSPDELLAQLTADQASLDALRAGLDATGTNYTHALDLTMRQINESMSDSQRQFMEHKVFFLSDGRQSDDVKDMFLETWKPFYEKHPEIDIYALGVGADFADKSGEAVKSLENVTGKPENVFTVDDFDSLSGTLSVLVTPDLGNILDKVRSADHTTVHSIYVGSGIDREFELSDHNDGSGMKHTGSIDLGNGISLVVYENGDYKLITSYNIADDTSYDIKLTVTDADGDRYTSCFMDFTVKDYLPVAFDKVAQLDPGYGSDSLFGQFGFFISDRLGWVLPSNGRFLYSSPYDMADTFDSILLPYMEHSCLKLSADKGTMSKENVEANIGSKNSLSQIFEDIGIETNPSYVSDTSASSVSMMHKTFSSKGGEIVFNWGFSGRNVAGEADAAFWVLLDENDNVIDSGKISDLAAGVDGAQEQSGLTRIPVPDSDAEQTYKLVVGSVDGGSANETNATLVINTMVFLEDKHHFAGNLLADASPEGENDQLHDKAGLTHVIYDDQSHEFDANGQIRIEMDSGLFVLNKNGEYTFAAKDGNVILVDEKLTYYLKDEDGDIASADLTIKGGGRRSLPAVAEDEHGFAHAQRLGGFEGTDENNTLEGNGWYTTGKASFFTGEAILPNALPIPSDDAIAGYLGEPYPWVRIHGKDQLTPKQCFTLFDTNDSDEIREIFLGAGIAADTFDGIESGPLAGAAMQKSFVSRGGEIAFGWSFAGGDNDAAFWIVKDGEGAAVDSGLLHQGGKENGVAHITVAQTAQAEEYVLTLGALKTGGVDDLEPVLYVSNVVLLEDEYHFKGSVIAGPDPEDISSLAFVRLESVSFDGETVSFDAEHQVREIETEAGRLRIDWKGNYTFRANDPEANLEGESFSYRLKGDTADSSGELLVRMHDPIIFDTMATFHTDKEYHFGGNVFFEPSPLGECDVVSSGTYVCRVEHNGKLYAMGEDESLAIATGTGGHLVIHRDGTYFFSDGPGSDGASAFENFIYTVADSRGHTDSAMLSIRGPHHHVGGNIEYEVEPPIVYCSDDFVAVGFGDELTATVASVVSAVSTDSANSADFADTAQEAAFVPLFADALAVGLMDGLDEVGEEGATPFSDPLADAAALIAAGDGETVLDIFDEAGSFGRMQGSADGKLLINDFSAAGGDRLSFSTLMEGDEDLADVFGKQFQNLSLDVDNNVISFAVVDDDSVKEVEIRFSPGSDAVYSDMLAEYRDAGSEGDQQEMLARFLLSLSVQ